MSNEFINLGSPRAVATILVFAIFLFLNTKVTGTLYRTHQFSELFYVLHGEGIFYIEDEKFL